tara:strand:+ start:741 stop:1586 length:846 start_codon:yes stop_codon:yes gene_type:complete
MNQNNDNLTRQVQDCEDRLRRLTHGARTQGNILRNLQIDYHALYNAYDNILHENDTLHNRLAEAMGENNPSDDEYQRTLSDDDDIAQQIIPIEYGEIRGPPVGGVKKNKKKKKTTTINKKKTIKKRKTVKKRKTPSPKANSPRPYYDELTGKSFKSLSGLIKHYNTPEYRNAQLALLTQNLSNTPSPSPITITPQSSPNEIPRLTPHLNLPYTTSPLTPGSLNRRYATLRIPPMDASKDDEELFQPVFRKLSFSGGKKKYKKRKTKNKKKRKNKKSRRRRK